ARAALALHEPEPEGVVALLVRARRPAGRHVPEHRHDTRAALGVFEAARTGAEDGGLADAGGEDCSEAALRRAAGRRADAARHRGDSGVVARARAADRVARGGEVPAERAAGSAESSKCPTPPPLPWAVSMPSTSGRKSSPCRRSSSPARRGAWRRRFTSPAR